MSRSNSLSGVRYLNDLSLPVSIPKENNMTIKFVAKEEITRPMAERIPPMNMVTLVLYLSLNKLATGPEKKNH